MGIKVTQDINNRSLPITVELKPDRKHKYKFTISAAIELRQKLEIAICDFQVAEALAGEIMHEDELPQMSDAEYSEWYEKSYIPGCVGCRVGPKVV